MFSTRGNRFLSTVESWGENCNSTSQPPSSSFTRLSLIKFTTTVQIGSPFHCAQINHRCSWCRAKETSLCPPIDYLLTQSRSCYHHELPQSLLKCADVREIANNFAKMSFMDFSRLTMQFPMDSRFAAEKCNNKDWKEKSWMNCGTKYPMKEEKFNFGQRMRGEIGNQSGKLSSAVKEIQLVTRSGELR